MAKLNRLRARFIQIQNIKKMTGVMEMIANAKIPKIKRHFQLAQEYFENLEYIFANVLENLETKVDEFVQTNSSKKLFVVFSSNLGFCGGLNNLVLKKMLSEFKQGDEIIVFGKKAYNFFIQKHEKEIIQSYLGIEETNFSEPILKVANFIHQSILDKKFAKILICYNKFVNIIHSKPEIHNLLDFPKSIVKHEGFGVEFEPNSTAVFQKLLPFYIKAILEKFFIEAKLVETSARRASMESATENALEIIQKLEIEINSSRQAMITQEIIEIISGKM
ncbi:ATP synthase F1 subunit gamma [Mycoplasma sp. 'Moose RK']|uniref:ATP synthase F1 subunit gamma n=1 Tax=Mycoplasma sp. 'Moose RK' TaxID=2780095 RepID=UPI0018C1CF90|nr:ATP synthase F1 subunit gamma [Mycoplasma sp. 'Moose RK']MBG0731003.1 ATP synthase F1 subunit gamma [Mycoplasma sp. 'Moose RK']